MKAVLLLSGGLDSYTAGAVARRDGYELYALTVRYGQVHVTEIASARKVARALGVARHVELDVDLAAFGGSSLVGDGEIPKDRLPPEGGSHKKMGEAGSHEKIGEAGSHEKIGEAGSHEDVPSTYVPARNTIFLSLALGWAEVLGADTIVIGVNALDYSGYPDCRPDYLEAFERLASLATRTGVEGGRFRIMAPLLTLSKAEIIRLGTGLGLDYGLTHSCYAPLPDGRPCGHCDSCLLRAKGFAEAGMTDPVTL